MIEIPYSEGNCLESRVFRFEYDSLNRLTAFIQAAGSFEEKRTQYTYNLFGEKITTIKPDGLTLHYTYDAVGRLQEYFSSDDSIHYQYCYDLNSNPTSIMDLVNDTTTERSYDAFNNIRLEKLQNGVLTEFDYAPDGKLLGVKLQDGSLCFTHRYAIQGISKIHGQWQENVMKLKRA